MERWAKVQSARGRGYLTGYRASCSWDLSGAKRGGGTEVGTVQRVQTGVQAGGFWHWPDLPACHAPPAVLALKLRRRLRTPALCGEADSTGRRRGQRRRRKAGVAISFSPALTSPGICWSIVPTGLGGGGEKPRGTHPPPRQVPASATQVKATVRIRPGPNGCWRFHPGRPNAKARFQGCNPRAWFHARLRPLQGPSMHNAQTLPATWCASCQNHGCSRVHGAEVRPTTRGFPRFRCFWHAWPWRAGLGLSQG